jgi:hypothetical protein
MTLSLGKRKRRESNPREKTDFKDLEAHGESDIAEIQEIFRKHFEDTFRPLNIAPVDNGAVEADEHSDEENEESTEWSGFTADEEPVVEVVDHGSLNTQAHHIKPGASAHSFMSFKPPTPKSDPSRQRTGASGASRKYASDSESEAEALNLKNDASLQQLLRESHLLDPSVSLTPSGVNRHKALDLRLQAAGSKVSVFEQQKMPMSHRKGIIAKRASLDSKRRQRAKEEGVILEKPAMKKKKIGRRERGVDGPSVGKLRGSTLILSRKDVGNIRGPKTSRAGTKRRRRK